MNELARGKLRVSKAIMGTIPIPSAPNVLVGVQIRMGLDSRLKHAGMTYFGLAVAKTQQAEGNEPQAIQFQNQILHFVRDYNFASVILSGAKNPSHCDFAKHPRVRPLPKTQYRL